jgi:Holliday junction resolvase RusA-like endonuclease
MDTIIEITLLGEPRGKGAPKFRSAGKYAYAYKDSKTRTLEATIHLLGQEALSSCPTWKLDGEYVVEIRSYFIPPVSWANVRREYAFEGKIRPTRKPDVDNIAKSINDGLTGVLWHDDKQVVDCRTIKKYAPVEQSIIRIKNIRHKDNRWG